MQILKSPLVLGVAAALCVASSSRGVTSQSQDAAPQATGQTPGQTNTPPSSGPATAQGLPQPASPSAIEKAREAMRRAMQQLSSGQSPQPKESKQISEARAALRRKMAQLNGLQAGTGQGSAAQAAPRQTHQATRGPRATRPQTSEPERSVAARAGKSRNSQAPRSSRFSSLPMGKAGSRNSQTTPPAKPQTTRPGQAQGLPTATPGPFAGGSSSYSQALPPPPAAVSREQQRKLDELLQRYRADQISPEQYQAQRAKILTGK